MTDPLAGETVLEAEPVGEPAPVSEPAAEEQPPVEDPVVATDANGASAEPALVEEQPAAPEEQQQPANGAEEAAPASIEDDIAGKRKLEDDGDEQPDAKKMNMDEVRAHVAARRRGA